MKLNIEALRAALAQPKTAIHCDTEEKAIALFEAMGWGEENARHDHRIFGYELCVEVYKNGRGATRRDWHAERGYTILTLDDYILPDKPRLCEVLGVEVGQEFVFDMPEYSENTYRINKEGDREVRINGLSGNWLLPNSDMSLTAMINNPHLIRIIPRWTEDDIADADAVMRLFPYMKWVARDKGGDVYLYREKPMLAEGASSFYGDEPYYGLSNTAFPSVTWENSPVKLEEIK